MCSAFNKERPNVLWAKNNRIAGPKPYLSFHCDLQRLLPDRKKVHTHTRRLSMSSWSLASDSLAVVASFGCLVDYGPLPSGFPTLISSCKCSFLATDWEQWVGCGIVNALWRGFFENGRVLHTALHHSNGAMGKALRLPVFTIVLRPLFLELWYNDDLGKL